MRRLVATAVVLLAAAAPATAQAPAVRWSAAACRGRTAYAEGKDAHATLFADGRVQVTIVDSASDRPLGERTVDGPHWRSSVGVDCAAMGIARSDVRNPQP